MQRILWKSAVLLTLIGSRQWTNNKTIISAVEEREPVTSYQPIHANQTRVDAVVSETDYQVAILTEALESPWGLTELPDGRLLITQKVGTLAILSPEDNSTSLIEGFPTVAAQGQGGLLDVAIHPEFDHNQLVFFTFSEAWGEGTLTAVGKGRLNEAAGTMEDIEVIFRAEPAYAGNLHYGSRILFDREGNLFVTTGERSDAGIRHEAQNKSNYLGTLVHITEEGEPVSGNPFVDEEGSAPAIYSYGHRNVQGMDLHPVTGELWISEMGPQGGDELNLIEPGHNYGWPEVSYGINYDGSPVSDGQSSGEGFTEPIYYWDPSIGPSGMAFYHSNVISEWQNNLFIGALAGTHIARLVIEDHQVVGEERLLSGEGERFRDIHVGADGAIYAITDSGRLYRITGE